ncbi:uncharacterized protein LOC116917263 [Daphnia magna]|uniref:uncharacterized protein LOC116917263 n=1 Tax=Daphnia magna TaxID=35525 RepID=UPI001401FC09|nr:uncharacterized protein LOC116917263 [Daphnia magna]
MTLADIELFREQPMGRQQLQDPAPWARLPVTIGYFPISKNAASKNIAEARALFNNIRHNQLRSTTMAYTDGSLNKTTGKTTCALYLPTLEIEETYTLNNRSSIFTAEAHVILKAMEAIYHHEELISELTVLTDSRSVLQTIENPGRETHEIIDTILSTAEKFKSAGTKVNLYWIPSHVGIPGNERADKLASEESSRQGTGRLINNQLSALEQSSIFRDNLKQINMTELQRGHEKDNTHQRKRTGPLKWHSHKSRYITRLLFRLRTGHNRLKANLARFNNQVNPICRNCEEEHETTIHVLLECSALEIERTEISSYLTTNNIEHNLTNLLGLNLDIHSTKQYEIQRLLTRYLKETRLVDII